MSVPGIVQSRLDGEQVAAHVPLGGEDALYVTRTRTLIYRADGLLSDESVEEYPHDAERIEISEGRRKSAIELDFGIEGAEKFKVPSNRLYEALHPVLAGVLNAADVTGADETVKQTYQFSELTLVITSERVVKHVGAAVWDEDYEEFHFDDVTALDVEEGNVSSQIIIETEGRPQRIKTPSDQTREVRERIERALLAHHGMGSYEEFARAHADPESQSEAEADPEDGDSTDEETADPLAGGVDPIDANPPELDEDGAIIDDDASVTTGERPGDADDGAFGEASDAGETADADDPIDTDDGTHASELTETAEAGIESDPIAGSESVGATGSGERGETGGFADSGFEPASSELESDDTEAQLEALTEAVQRQNELLAEQQRTLEQLVEELSRGR
ncbi:hypothetical protein NGM10_13210 [Halorussus salilacus]|uniref:DUF7115 domain-containing protein n=1 Tax=Halorussus salilacus TaxID=2953750 RepID=UPI0020A1AD5B|nr:hypothetical protein [Halorussus salilacus]USZ67681.1 hypothetical protein NGM10_13210 [Halorussus salilacus]